MSPGAFSLAGALLVLPACVMLCRHYWLEYLERDETADVEMDYLLWAAKGLGLPLLLWTVLNVGVSNWMPPLMPEVHMAKLAGGDWGNQLYGVLGASFALMSGCWAAATLAWVLVLSPFPAETRRDLLSVCLVWALVLTPVNWFILRGAGIPGLGVALTLWLWPVAHFALPLRRWEVRVPSYSRAVAKIKFGKYAAAEQEVIQELDKCADDYEGWLMLAELYARHFHDLPEADRTIIELCDQPNLSGAQISMALQRLADWHLKLGDNPHGARRAFEAVCIKLPGSYFAREAQQRMARLPSSREELLEEREAKPVRLPALKDPLDGFDDSASSQINREEAVRAMNRFVDRLKHDPNDVGAREQLARTLAEQLGKVDAGIEQLELLLGMPGQPEARLAEWLGLTAAWRLRYDQDPEAAKPALERLVREHPQSPQAFSAQRHLNLMEREGRLQGAGPRQSTTS